MTEQQQGQQAQENPAFLTQQLITCIGNKRALIPYIEREIEAIREELGGRRLVCADLFAGSGVVSRMLKRHARCLVVADLEEYSCLVNRCYLTNEATFPRQAWHELSERIERCAASHKVEGIISQNYAPQDDAHIQKGERVFYTHENALLIDTYRTLIDQLVPAPLQHYFLAPLVTSASVHANTSGVFKGFYKDKRTGVGCFGGSGRDALHRITGKIEMVEPVLSAFDSDVQVIRGDAVSLAPAIGGVDVAYLDPPYNQHPYGSNYFMLNLIIKNRLDVPVSRVSGITQDWRRSAFNNPKTALPSLEAVVSSVDAKFVIVSYNSEGFISLDDMTAMLTRYGKVATVAIPYNTFRGSRNLHSRSIHVKEYLFVLRK